VIVLPPAVNPDNASLIGVPDSADYRAAAPCSAQGHGQSQRIEFARQSLVEPRISELALGYGLASIRRP